MLTALAHGAALGTLICIMLGVGLGLPEPILTLGRKLRGSDVRRSLLLNFFWIPLLGFVLGAWCRRISPDLAQAVVLFACFPAGPISLMFVARRPEALARSVGVLLFLQLASVVLSPLLLLLAARLSLLGLQGESPGRALLALGTQMVLLELVPIVFGALLLRRFPQAAPGLRRSFRHGATACLVLAALGFAHSFRTQLTETTWLLGVGPFALLSLTAWLGALALPGSAKLDTAQIAGLRNISLALVFAADAGQGGRLVLHVLVGAAVTTVAAPLLRALRQGGAAGPVGSSG